MARPKKIEVAELSTEDYSGLSPSQKYLLMSEARMVKKFPTARHSTGATEENNPLFIEMRDLGVQYALGRIGYVCGRVHYTLGMEGSGKTSRMLTIANETLKQGGLATIVEWENALAPHQITAYIDHPEDLKIWHADCLEEGMEMIREVLRIYAEMDPEGKMKKMIGADSIGGSVMKRSLEDDRLLGDSRVGGYGLYMSDAAGVIGNQCARTKTLWCVIGQARELIDTGFGGAPKPWIEKIVGKGGKAIPFAATYWEVIKRGATIKDGDIKSGFTVTSVFKKNKMGVQFREYSYDIMFNSQINSIQHTMNMLTGIGELKSKLNRFWCEPLGVSEKEKMKPSEMYALIHSPDHIGRFQKELGIQTDLSSNVILTDKDKEQMSDAELAQLEDEATQKSAQFFQGSTSESRVTGGFTLND